MIKLTNKEYKKVIKALDALAKIQPCEKINQELERILEASKPDLSNGFLYGGTDSKRRTHGEYSSNSCVRLFRHQGLWQLDTLNSRCCSSSFNDDELREVANLILETLDAQEDGR